MMLVRIFHHYLFPVPFNTDGFLSTEAIMVQRILPKGSGQQKYKRVDGRHRLAAWTTCERFEGNIPVDILRDDCTEAELIVAGVSKFHLHLLITH